MLRYVNTASSAGGNGTTNDTSGANRAYASLSAWEAAEQADLTSLAEIAEVRCCGTAADTTAVVIDGWTTNATYYIRIRGNPTDGNGRHAGVWSSSHYRLESAQDGPVLTINESYTRVEGLQVYNTYSTAGDHNPTGIEGSGASACLADALLVRGTPNAADFINYGMRINGTIRNCIAFNWRNTSTNRGTGIQRGADANTVVQNCTAYNCHRGFFAPDDGLNGSTQLLLTNCLGANCGSAFVAEWSFAFASDYNASDQSDAPGSNSRQSQTFSFTNTGSFDFSLTGSDAGARDFGTDLSGSFTVDVANQTRTGTWDIGAWEYVAPGGGGSYSLAVDAMSVASTMTAINLLRGRRIVVDTNTWQASLTDINASLGRRVIVDGNAYSLTNTDVGLRGTRLLGIDPMTVQTTFSDIGVASGRKVVVDPLSVGLVGQDVGLLRGYLLGIDSGTISVALTDIDVRYGLARTITVDPASFNLNLSPVTLRTERRLEVESGQWQTALTAITLGRDRVVLVDPDSVEIIMSPVQLVYSSAPTVTLRARMLTGVGL